MTEINDVTRHEVPLSFRLPESFWPIDREHFVPHAVNWGSRQVDAGMREPASFTRVQTNGLADNDASRSRSAPSIKQRVWSARQVVDAS